MDEKVKEIFASLEHKRWLKWMQYLFTKGIFKDGSFIIEPSSVTHWMKEINTPYDELTEAQKDSDRKEVEIYYQYYNDLISLLSEKDKEIEELKKERNLAIAHDTQPYPTAWAYEQLCKSSHEKETRIKKLEVERTHQEGKEVNNV